MKLIVLHVLRALGFFYLSRRLVANKTLILAYHGFEVLDETRFRDQLFIKAQTLKQRFDYLKKHCNVVPLDAFDQGQSENQSENQSKDQSKNQVMITIDDGWYSTLSVAAPLLKQYNMPYTVYLTTENVLDNQPIFHIALDYILGHNLGKRLIYANGRGFDIDRVISHENIDHLCQSIKAVKTQPNDTALLSEIAKALQFDFQQVIDKKTLTLMSVDEVRSIKALGASIQLHTHTHNTPLDDGDLFAEEINLNRQHIIDIVGQTPEHHCYPSGVYNLDSFAHLRCLNVKTATTCYPGFVNRTSDNMELPRFLDAENIPQIVFEAEVSGVLEIFRNLRKTVTGLFRRSNLTTQLQ